MCGITCIVDGEVSERQLLRSIQALRHRGPDGSGHYLNHSATLGLAHARLSIIDLTTGGQPLFSEDRSLVLVANGEIYDYERIREELIARGHRFSTKSDSEVILHLYREHGVDAMFEQLRGEFAFLLYDEQQQRLIAARDRFGIKPLYVAEANGAFVFSSEAKGIFATGVVQPELDPRAVRDMMSMVPVDSMFRHLRSVEPGSYLRLDLSTRKAQSIRYWNSDLPRESELPPAASVEEYTRSIRTAVDEAVSLRLRADVPVGVYLSGGLDSSAVAGTVSKVLGKKVHAFTVAFTDGDHQFNELELATKTAAWLGAELHVARCSNDALVENLRDCLWYSELPTDNLHGVGKFVLSKLAKEHVSVVLTGEGSDETFLGYDFFRRASTGALALFKYGPASRPEREDSPHGRLVESKLGFIPQHPLMATTAHEHQRLLRWLLHRRHRAVLAASSPLDLAAARLDREQLEGRSWLKQMQHFTLRAIMAPYILAIVGDRPQMAHSVEGRTPLLDHHLFDAARRVPDELKLKENVEKYILREAMRDRVLPEVYANKKWPYLAPPFWLKSSTSPKLRQLLETYLSKDAIDEAGIFDFKSVFTLRALLRLLPGDTKLKRRINLLLLSTMSIQIVHELLVKNLDANIDSFAATAESTLMRDSRAQAQAASA